MAKYYWHKADKGAAFWQWLAYRLPRRLVYYAALRLMVHATVGKWSSQVVPELRAMDALMRWQEGD